MTRDTAFEEQARSADADIRLDSTAESFWLLLDDLIRLACQARRG